MSFAMKDYTAGQLNAMTKKMKDQFGEGAPDRFLREELVLCETEKTWIEENGIIRFSVTSNGMTGKEWIDHFNAKGIKMTGKSEFILKSKDFNDQVTKGLTTQIAVLKGGLFSNSGRNTRSIIRKRSGMNLSNLSLETACLIREKFTDKEFERMGLDWIVIMYESISISSRFDPSKLIGNRNHGCWLKYIDWDFASHSDWGRNLGFAFSKNV